MPTQGPSHLLEMARVETAWEQQHWWRSRGWEVGRDDTSPEGDERAVVPRRARIQG